MESDAVDDMQVPDGHIGAGDASGDIMPPDHTGPGISGVTDAGAPGVPSIAVPSPDQISLDPVSDAGIEDTGIEDVMDITEYENDSENGSSDTDAIN